MCHTTTIYHSCRHPDLNYWSIRCATSLEDDPNCRKDPSSLHCKKTGSIWSTPFKCTSCVRRTRVRHQKNSIGAASFYDEGMDVDEDECCEQAFDEGEVERMDRELDDLDTDDDEVEDIDISRYDATLVYSEDSSCENRKRKFPESIEAEYEGSDEVNRGRASGPRKRREPKYEGRNMRGRTRQRVSIASRRVERRNSGSIRRL